MAEGFTKKYSNESIKVSSAGSQPAEEVEEKAIKVMEEKGIDISDHQPEELSQEKAQSADYIITMGCGSEVCPGNLYNHREWDLENPRGKSLKKFREIRDKIEKKVKKLIKEIED